MIIIPGSHPAMIPSKKSPIRLLHRHNEAVERISYQTSHNEFGSSSFDNLFNLRKCGVPAPLHRNNSLKQQLWNTGVVTECF